MSPTDREQELQSLADENARWAEAELQLIEAIQQHKQRLARLPEIIRLLPGIIQELEEQRKIATAGMLRIGAEHDVAEAKFRAWADDQADDYADHRLAVQPPVGW